MYHLFVSGNDEAWGGDPWIIEANRCLRYDEYTAKPLILNLAELTPDDHLRICGYPCIFAYETGTKKNALLGRIKKIRNSGMKLQIQYELDADYPPIKHEDLIKLRWELGIGELELNRTHWALKDEDASVALESVGYPAIDHRPLVKISDHTFDIALSFPGEVRPYVEEVAQRLTSAIGRNRVFYDNTYKSQLAKPNLDTALQALYQRARLIVVFLSGDYAAKKWCHIEFRAIREIINAREDDRVMYVRHDSAQVAGVFSTDGYIDADEHKPAELVEMILERLALLPKI